MISKISILAVMLSFCISALLGPVLIPWLKKLKIGQTVREDGPAGHLKKNGTPTIGGLSEDGSHSVPDRRLWTDRLSG